MVTYTRVGTSRLYVPAAFASRVALARIAFVRAQAHPDPGAQIDVRRHLTQGTVVVFPTISDAVASSLAQSVPREIDDSTPAGRQARIAFLTAAGGLRFGESVLVDATGAVSENTPVHVGDPTETNDRGWRVRIPRAAKVLAGDKGFVIDLSSAHPEDGGFYADGKRAPFPSAQPQIELVLEGVARGTLRFALEMNDELLERFGVGPRYFAQESVEEDTLRTSTSSFPLYRLGDQAKAFTCQIDLAAPHEDEPVSAAPGLEAPVARVPRSLLRPPGEALRTNLHAVHGADVHLIADHREDAPAGFALTSSPKAITSAGGRVRTLVQSHYFAPIGTFSLAAGGSPRQRLSLGLSNLETLAVQPGLDTLTFVPGNAAYDARKNDLAPMAPGGDALVDFEGLCRTSWLRLDPGDGAASAEALSIQPEGMQAYRAAAGDPATMAFSPARFAAPATPFPFAPLLGVRGDSARQRLQFESDVIAKARRACIQAHAAARTESVTVAAAGVAARTPQGFVAVRSDDGATWSELLFTRTSKRQGESGGPSELSDVALRATAASVALLSQTMSQNRLMVVTTWRTLQQLAFDLDAFGRMHIGGWGVRLSPFAEGDDPMVVIKYDSRPLRELVGRRDQWTAADKFDPGGTLQARLQEILAGATADDDLLGKLARRVDDPSWNGLLVLAAKLPLDGIPDQMRAIAAGLPKSLDVPYLGLDVSGIDPEQPAAEPWRSALFGLVRHDDRDPAWEEDAESQVKMRVPRLVLRVENDAIDRFECTIELRIPQLFDFRSTRPDDVLALQGRYESRVSSGKRHDTYIFEAAGSYRKEFGAQSVVRDIELRRLRLVTTRSEGDYTEGRFLIDGDISFNELGGVDLLGIEKLEFTDFAIDLGFFVEGLRRLKLKFNYPNLKFDLDGFNTGGGRRRPNADGSLVPGFLRSFPLKLKGLRFGDFDLSSLGFLRLGNLVSAPGFEIGSDFKFALEFDLDLGSLGTLAKKLERFKLQVLVGWKPVFEGGAFKLNRIAAGFRIDLGEGGGGIDLGLQDILRLRAERFNFKREKVGTKDLIILSADDCHLDVLGTTFPEDGKFSLFLFANLGDPNPFERPGWYASFKDAKAKPPIAIEHLVMAQRVDVKLGEVTTTRDALAWIGKQETFDKDDPDAAAKFMKFAGQGGVVRYDRNRDWFIALKGDFFKVCRIAVLLKDPDVYGAYVGLLAEDDPSQALMSFDLLYQKLADGVGRYVVEVGLPPGYRTFEVGVASVTIGMIRLEIFTDGGFLVDLGFPQHVDYSRSFAVQAYVFIGKGGLYLGRTPAVTVPGIPAGYGPVVRAGFAMKVGLGREFEYGPIRAGLSLCVFGRTEGYFAAASGERHPDGTPIAPYPYWMRLHGEAGIIAEIEGSVDLRLIRARLLIRIWVASGIVLETALPVLLYCEAGVSVAVEFEIASFKVFGKRIRITVMLRFSTTLRFEYALPARMPAFGASGLELAAFGREAPPAGWPAVTDPSRLGVRATPVDLRLVYDVARVQVGKLVAVPTLMWLQPASEEGASAFPIAVLARALIGWAALRASPGAQSALDIPVRKGRDPDPQAPAVLTFDELERLVRDLDDVPLDKLETLLSLVLGGSTIAHVEETGDQPVEGYVLPIPFGLRIEAESAGQKEIFDYATRGAVSEQAVAALLDGFDHQFMEIGARPTDAGLFATGEQPLIRYLFRSWCTALALAVLDAARTEWKLKEVVEDRALRDVLAAVPPAQWKNAAARAGRLLLAGLRVEEDGVSKSLSDRAGLFIGLPAGGRTKLRLLAPTTATWFGVSASELELDVARVAPMATAAVSIESRTVRPLAVRILPRRFYLPHALEARIEDAPLMRLARFSTDLLAQIGETAFSALAFSAREPAAAAAPAARGTPLQQPRAAIVFEIGLQRVVSGQAGATTVAHVPGAYQISGAREGDRLGLDALMALGAADTAALRLDATQLHVGWRAGFEDDEHVRLLLVPEDVRGQVLVTRSTVSVQRRPYVEALAVEAASPEEIFRADFTPQSRFALLYLLQRAALVNATGTHLLLPEVLAKPLDAHFALMAQDGRDRVDLMFTLVFADGARLPTGALNAAAFQLPADMQALARPRAAVVELAAVPQAGAAGWRDDSMFEAVPLRPAGTELVRTWRHRVASGGSGDATAAGLAAALAARFDMQEFEVTVAGSSTPLIDADAALPQSSEVAVPSEFPDQMREWLTAEKPAGFADDGLRYDVIVPVSKLLADKHDAAPSPYAAIGKSFQVDLRWRDVYGNRLDGNAWSRTIEHCYTDPLVPVSAWPGIQTRVFPGAAGSRELVLEFAVDEPALPKGDGRDVMARELQRILHQLEDPRVTVSAVSPLQPGAVRSVDRAVLAAFVAQLHKDVAGGSRASEPRRQFRFQYVVPPDRPFHEVSLSVAIERPEQFVGHVDPERGGARIPGAGRVQSPVRLVASIDAFDGAKESASQLAAEFQAAFAFVEGGTARRLWLARGAADHAGSQWWAIDDRVFPEADARPAVAYAMPPLARARMSGQIELRAIARLAEADTDYLQNTFGADEVKAVTVRAMDRDVDQLMADFLERVEAFLSSAHAPVTAAVAALDGAAASPFESVARQKARLLDIHGEDPPLLGALMNVFADEPGTSGALKAARDELREACAQHLQRFYEVGCVVSKGLRSRAPVDWFTARGNDRPKLYGQLTFTQADGADPGFRATTRGIPLEAGGMQLAAAVIPESKQSSVVLGPMRYRLTHVERLVAAADEGRLAPSRWLTIVALPGQNLPAIEVAAPGVAPFPVRRVPKNPALDRPVVRLYDGDVAATYAEQVALARRWTYGFEAAAELKGGDEVCGRLIYNAPVGGVPAALETPASPLVPGLFEALVAHEREVEPYWRTIIGEAGRRAAGVTAAGADPELRFRNACDRFARSVQNVVDAFMMVATEAAPETVAQDRFVLSHDALTTRIRFIDHMAGDGPWKVLAGDGRPWLRVRQIRSGGPQAATVDGVIADPGTEAKPVEAAFTFLQADENGDWRRRQVDVGRLDALRQQTVWAAASVRRNDKIANRKARAEFVYRTPEIFLQELISPNLVRRRTIRLSPSAPLSLHQLLVEGLSPVIDDAEGLARFIQVRADYESGQLTEIVESAMGAVTDEPGSSFTPEPDPKLLLAGVRVGAGTGAVKVDALARTLATRLAGMFKGEAIAARPDGDRGCLVLNVTIRASEDGRPGLPVLRLERLCLDLRHVTDL
jgi:hypothetical protein